MPGCGERYTLVVAMLTYRRPQDVVEAIPAVLDQVAGSDLPARLLVVDNDPEASAMELADRYPADLVRFVHEPVPGIAAARNRALTEAAEEDLLVFIDDDERPEPGWLRHLYRTWCETRADAVVGAVVSTYPRPPEEFIAEGGFFERRRLPTGTSVDVAATNNLLLDLTTVRRTGLRFDERFGASGGSDTLFTRALHRSGGRMVWCDEAVVVDVVPSSRLTRSWVLRRALRSGNSWSRVELALEPSPLRRLTRRLSLSALGVARVLYGSARWCFGAVSRSVRHRARGAKALARGAGMVGGAWGWTYVEYRRPQR